MQPQWTWCRPCLSGLAVLSSLAGPIGLVGPDDRARTETSAGFAVSADIVAGCLIDGLGGSGNAGSIGILDFGTDSAFSTANHVASIAASQSVRLRCTPGVSVRMQIDGGLQPAAGVRRLQHASDGEAAIGYALCADAACSLPIAIGATVAVPVGHANDSDVRLPIFARLDLPGDLPAGSYHDTLMVSLSW